MASYHAHRARTKAAMTGPSCSGEGSGWQAGHGPTADQPGLACFFYFERGRLRLHVKRLPDGGWAHTQEGAQRPHPRLLDSCSRYPPSTPLYTTPDPLLPNTISRTPKRAPNSNARAQQVREYRHSHTSGTPGITDKLTTTLQPPNRSCQARIARDTTP